MDFDKPKVYGDTSITDGLVCHQISNIQRYFRLLNFNLLNEAQRGALLPKFAIFMEYRLQTRIFLFQRLSQRCLVSTLTLVPGDLGTKLVLDQVADKDEVCVFTDCV